MRFKQIDEINLVAWQGFKPWELKRPFSDQDTPHMKRPLKGHAIKTSLAMPLNPKSE